MEFTSSFSNSSSDFPFVSGTLATINNKHIFAKIAYNKKVNELPRLDKCQGKTSCTKKANVRFTKPTNEIANPGIRFGNSSEKSTHITGPMDTA